MASMRKEKQYTFSLPAKLIMALCQLTLILYVGISRADEVNSDTTIPATESPLLTVSILVLGGEAKTPVSHAHIYLRPTSDDSQLSEAFTNSNGMAVLEGVPRTHMRLQVTTADWLTRALVLDFADPQLASPIEVVLEPSHAE